MVNMRRQAAANVNMSNRLYNGEVSDFRDAMQTIIRGMEGEKRECAEWNAQLGPNEQQYRWDGEIFSGYAQAAHNALRIYSEIVRKAEQEAAAAIRALGGDENERIATALESGDYTDLAW